MYHEAHYDIILLLGMTEVKAQIAWKHNVRRSLFAYRLCSVTRQQGIEKRCVVNGLLNCAAFLIGVGNVEALLPLSIVSSRTRVVCSSRCDQDIQRES